MKHVTSILTMLGLVIFSTGSHAEGLVARQCKERPVFAARLVGSTDR